MKLTDIFQRMQTNKLTEIIIEFDTIDDLKGQQLANLLSQSDSVQTFGLYHASVTKLAIEAIAKAIVMHPSLSCNSQSAVATTEIT